MGHGGWIVRVELPAEALTGDWVFVSVMQEDGVALTEVRDVNGEILYLSVGSEEEDECDS